MALKLGIIGLGIMGERLLRVALEHAGTEVAAVWDPAPRAAARLAGTGLSMAPSAEAVIDRSEAVYVASPPASHIALGDAVLQAGRALFLEKPLASDVAAARRFVAGAQGRRAAVNFPMASSPAVARLREWLPAIGPVAGVAITLGFAAWPRAWQAEAAAWLDGRAEGGFTREVASHFLFLAQRLCGPLALESGRTEYGDPARSEVAASARLRAGGVPVSLEGCVGAVDAEDTNACVFEGARGRLRLRDWSIAERWQDGAWSADAEAVPNARMRPVTLGGQLERLAALTRGEASGLASLEEALSVQEAVEAILAGR